MASPGFSLRSMVGGSRPSAPATAAAAPPADNHDGDDDAEPPQRFGGLGSVIGRSASTRVEHEEAVNAPAAERGRSIFRYSKDAGSFASPRPLSPQGSLRAAPLSAAPAAPAGPSAAEVRQRFDAMDSGDEGYQREGLRRRASQVVSNTDDLGPRPRATSPVSGRSATFRYRDGAGAAPRSLAGGFYGSTSASRRDAPAPRPAYDNHFGDPVDSVADDDADPRTSGEVDSGYRVGSQGRPSSDYEPTDDFATADYSERPPDDDEQIVPQALLESEERPTPWEEHPAHGVVLALLDRRGVIPEQFPELVQYHMARGFLEFLQIVTNGAYFVKYGQKGTAPKERFVRLRMLSDDVGRPVPCLVITIHRDAVQIIDRIRLEDLVGITRGVEGSAFRRHLVHYDVIKGSFVGQRRAHLSTKGAFTLWFYDRRSRQPKSLDLLTTNLNVFDVWLATMEGVLSVNSVCIHRTNVAQQMQQLFRLAQQQLDDGDEE